MHAAIPFPDISPDIFTVHVFGLAFSLRWYALAYIAGILIGWRVALLALRRPRLWPGDTAPMASQALEDLLTWVVLGVILGGRLGYVLIYNPEFYLANPVDAVKVWQGGMSFHGGMLGVVTACVIFARRRGVRLFQLADLLCMVAPAGLLLGRVANFVNAELWGRPTELPWGVIFPGLAAQDCPGVVPGMCARHPSQLYEAALEGLILGGVLLWLAWRRGALKQPGRITGLFFAGYGIARFLVEFVRQPDAQFISADNPLGLALHYHGYGLTMGQLLSLPMIVFGLWLVRRRARGKGHDGTAA